MKKAENILKILQNGKSMFLIGPTDSGKSEFAKNYLIPFLINNGFKVIYFSDRDKISTIKNSDVAIIDETESLQDKKVLEENHPENNPYYSTEYLAKIASWFKKLRAVNIPCIYIITRNDKSEIKNFVDTIKTTDWDKRAVEILEFNKEDRVSKNQKT